MKKLLLLTVSGAFSLASFAQNRLLRDIPTAPASAAVMVQQGTVTAGPVSNTSFRNLAKTTGVPFVTENFGSGTATSLPTGWTAGGNVAATWQWRNAAWTTTYSLPAIISTTAANGWIGYNADSIGRILNPTTVPLTGWITSPSYNCATHPSVSVSFEEQFKKFADTCFVDVSNNGGTTWTPFQVLFNSAMPVNTFLPTNSYRVSVNISSVAANQANVKIRFRYSCRQAGGAYNWLIDDMTLSELDPVEAGVQKSFMFYDAGTTNGLYAYGSIPAKFSDSVFPGTLLANYGANALTNVTVNGKIYQGTTQVYSKNVVFPSLPVNAYDSIVDFTTQAGYLPVTNGAYTMAYNVNHAGDATPANNNDTARFNLTDSTWSENVGFLTGDYYLHRPASGTVTETFYTFGTLFATPNNKTDTLTAIQVAFGPSTVAGSKISVHVYKMNGATPAIFAAAIDKTLTAADISTTAGGTVWARFAMDASNGPAVLTGDGTFVAVVKTNGVAAGSVVTLRTSQNPAPYEAIGTTATQDTAVNTGAFDFTFKYRFVQTPLINLIFNDYKTVGIGTLAPNSGVKANAYPNPSNTELNISFQVSKDANASVKLTNTLGQVVKSQNVGNVTANQNNVVSFSTSELASGVYYYTVEADGQRSTNRVEILH